jgi:hypothetical protein
MENKVHASSLWKRILLALGLLLLPFSILSSMQAKSLESGPGRPTVAIIFVADQPAAARMVRLITHKVRNLKLVKGLAKGSPCAANAPEDYFDFGSCMGGCLSDVGVSYTQVIMCGASCAAAGTGIGAIVCAICVGVDVTVVVACAIGCAAYPGPYKHGMLLSHNSTSGHPDRVTLRAKLTPQSARSSY